ncbi:MAG: uncharacterized protein QOE92_1375, partial [Chloroflexota bacterium]|nr:uncharacterized protein [Chloroflexota bacterium]
MTSTARVTGADTLSSYLGLVDGELVDLAAPGSTPAPLARLVHDSLGAVIDSPGFTCLGAKAARHQGFYRMGVFGALGDAESTAALAAALERFVAERAEWDAEYSTMIASFTGPVGLDEEAFETALWDQLSALHRLDRAPWDPRVSSEPDSPEFSFSFAGEGFFVVGLHGGASRWTRRFAWPTLVFN